MARLPKSGIKYRFPDEREVTLAEIVASLGLKPLTKKAQSEIRRRLGSALAIWDEPYTALQTQDVGRSLRARAKELDHVASLGAITRTGFALERDIADGEQVVQILMSNPEIGTLEAAHEYLRNFCDGAGIMASSCRAAADGLESSKGRPGKSIHGWYDEFTAVLLDLCKRNKIEPTFSIDRSSGEAAGNLSQIAMAFERLLPPQMRSGKPSTLIKRLGRSVERLGRRPLPGKPSS